MVLCVELRLEACDLVVEHGLVALDFLFLFSFVNVIESGYCAKFRENYMCITSCCSDCGHANNLPKMH